MKTPNLFKIATKELSQDGFFTWLIQWANEEYIQINSELNETAKDFIRLLMKESNNFKINKVNAKRQWEHIDICVEINDNHVIIIEDKTNTREHSNQLNRYREIVEKAYESKNYISHYIYLKTGNEDLSSMKKIEEKGYSVISRKSILEVLNKRVVQNDIFIEFTENLNAIEDRTNSCNTIEDITKRKSAEGFFLKLQEKLQVGKWQYVANASGGFLGFWYYHTAITDNLKMYIQIENYFKEGIKVVIKTIRQKGSKEKITTEMLKKMLKGIQPLAKKQDLSITKPSQYRAGETATLAIVKDVFPESGELDVQKIIIILKRIEKVIEAYCNHEDL